MNEQLVVKNFGPIKDAKVDFKRVTVFIGPTGGGKSTLAKLAAVFRNHNSYPYKPGSIYYPKGKSPFEEYSISNYENESSEIGWTANNQTAKYTGITSQFDLSGLELPEGWHPSSFKPSDLLLNFYKGDVQKMLNHVSETNRLFDLAALITPLTVHYLHYFPSERIFVSALEYSWPGLLRDDIGLPKGILDFANSFSTSRKDVPELHIPFLNAQYLHQNGQDFIKIPGSETLFRLYETASGIQSVTPLLVLLEHLSRNTEQAQSFIIEEPELNLYPTAQQGLLNWLVEKCTKGENDLTITTHSPYLLAHFNLLLYAHQVAKNHPDRADDVARIVPRESWIDPKEFAAYHVEGQQENGVRSIVNPETGLISHNSLDSTASAETAEFEKLLDINAGLEVE